jgi:hypothetical protein
MIIFSYNPVINIDLARVLPTTGRLRVTLERVKAINPDLSEGATRLI